MARDDAVAAVQNVLARLGKRSGLSPDRLRSTEIDARPLLTLPVVRHNAELRDRAAADVAVQVVRALARQLPPTQRIIADTVLNLEMLRQPDADTDGTAVDLDRLYGEDLGARRDYLVAHWDLVHRAQHTSPDHDAPTVRSLRTRLERTTFTDLATLLIDRPAYDFAPGGDRLDQRVPPARLGAVTVIGDAVIDQIYRVQTPPQPDTAVRGTAEDTPGGKALNRAIAAARLGLEVRLLCAVGDDDAGRRVLTWLRRYDVDVSLVKVVPDAPTPVTALIIAPGQPPAVIACRPDRTSLTAEDVLAPARRDGIATADAVLMSFEQPAAVVEQVLASIGELAEPPPLIVHAGPPLREPQRLYPYLQAVDYLVGTEAELRALLPGVDADITDIVQYLRTFGTGTVCVMESTGCHVRSADLDLLIPPYSPIPAGSPRAHAAFSAALAYRLLRRERRRPAEPGDFRFAAAAMVASQLLDVPGALSPLDRIDQILTIASEEH
ncbi:carbohydrate kinase family protein [Nocardia pseudobrasiliensis]|uniref:Ribokinase n=1 Tax=Nocardia pseudobrasiliensis TaxID=45979 RepID=A0A370HY32_9NOCA|nr:carbohydrate kinase family protein [Nocardia pseudobrasiliensis]RDI63418.1 ribokinase [Nocardia pseudobrasiliensis]